MAARLNARGVARMMDVLQRAIDGGRLPGAVVVLGTGGEVSLCEVLGQQDPQAGTPMREDSIFRIYSMTKPIVSAMAVMLAEEGVLQLVDPVSKFLPEFAGQKVAVEEDGGVRLERAPREATVHDLLRHTAGLTYEFLGNKAVQGLYQQNKVGDRTRPVAEHTKMLASLPLQDAPGTRWQYSRATDVLGAVVATATGRSLGELLRERIFEPLGMHDTAFSVPQAQWGRIAEAFEKDPDTGAPVRMIDPREVPLMECGGGGLLGTAPDYTRFLQLMRNKGSVGGTRLLSRKAVEWMTADHLGGLPSNDDLLPPGYGFGLGFAVRTHAGLAPLPGSVGQYYWSGIGGTFFFVDPQEDVFAMLLTQAPNQRIHFRNLFRHLVYGALD